MGDIRDQLIKTRSLDDMDSNAEITDVSCKYEPRIRIVGRYSHGGMRAGGSKYPKNGTNTVSATKSEAFDVLTCEDRAEWINENWYELKNDYGFKSFSSKVNVYVDLRVIVGYELTLFDDDVIYISEEILLNSTSHCLLLQNGGIGSEVNVNRIEEEYVVLELDGEDWEYMRSEVNSGENQFTRFLIDVLSTASVWCTGTFGTFTEADDKLKLPLQTSTGSYTFRFEEPFDDSNLVWDLANEFDFEDPWNLENERCKYSVHSMVRSGFRKDFVRIGNMDREEDSTTSTFISDVISRLTGFHK